MSEQGDSLKAYNHFWTSFLQKAHKKTDLYSGLTAKNRLYLTVQSGLQKIVFHPVIKKFNAHVELLIGLQDQEEIDLIHQYLFHKKEQIEREFGGALEWIPRGERDRRAQVRKTIYTGGWAEDSNWNELQDEMIDYLDRLYGATMPHLKNYWA